MIEWVADVDDGFDMATATAHIEGKALALLTIGKRLISMPA